MGKNNGTQTTINVPVKIFESMIKTYRTMEELHSEFEDFLLAHDKNFIKKMRKARNDHLENKTKNIDLLKF